MRHVYKPCVDGLYICYRTCCKLACLKQPTASLGCLVRLGGLNTIVLNGAAICWQFVVKVIKAATAVLAAFEGIRLERSSQTT